MRACMTHDGLASALSVGVSASSESGSAPPAPRPVASAASADAQPSDDQPSGDQPSGETCQHPVAKDRYTSHHVAAVWRPYRERV
eukprot:203491-Prymnesium_polylepis.1